MRLPEPDLSRDAQLEEFDEWVTPALAEITDSQRFLDELSETERILDFITVCGTGAHNVEQLSESVAHAVADMPYGDSRRFIESLFSVLFLVTARSDNAVKCQFPIFLRTLGRGYPKSRRHGAQQRLDEVEVPRVLKAADIAANVAALDRFPEQQIALLEAYLRFVLSGTSASRQLAVIAEAYSNLKVREDGSEGDLLAPLVAFKVRGSVSASGGHTPEYRVRSQMEEWGLRPGRDFNLADVVVDAVFVQGGDPTAQLRLEERADDMINGVAEAPSAPLKSRAFDFVVPFLTDGEYVRLFIQSQFYAGDSGSVSHKNVDQARQSRRETAELVEQAVRFIELVDGAGYCASLRRDLQHLIFDDLTHSFFQLRSAPVRLRRAIQTAGFVTPLEIEQLVAMGIDDSAAVRDRLARDGYAPAEVQRALDEALQRELVSSENDRLHLRAGRRETVTAFLVLDCLVTGGRVLDDGDRLDGTVRVPGQGPHYGAVLDEVETVVGDVLEALDSATLPSPGEIRAALRWLAERGHAIVEAPRPRG